MSLASMVEPMIQSTLAVEPSIGRNETATRERY